MSLEHDIKETFMKHAEDVRPDVQSWPAVEKKVARARAQRIGVATIAVAAVIAAATIGLTRIHPKAQQGFIGPRPTPAIGSTVATSMDTSAAFYRNEEEGWQVAYPQAWGVANDSVHTDFSPPGLPGGFNGKLLPCSPNPNGGTPICHGGPTYRVDVTLETGTSLEQAKAREQHAGSNWRSLTLAGHQALLDTQPISSLTWLISWSQRDCTGSPCSWTGPAVLRINTFASTRALADKYAALGGDIVSSLTSAADAGNLTFPSGTLVWTPHGKIDSYPVFDGATAALTRFLEAEVQGKNLAPYYSTRATSGDKRDPCMGFVPEKHPACSTYEVSNRQDTGSGVAFDVLVVYIAKSGVLTNIGPFTVTVAKDANGGPFLIRSVTIVQGGN